MLEKLGDMLKKTTDKIANAIFLSKDLVESIVRDLQRALIEADVNILLVKELSEKIRKEAFDERIKGIEKREHLIKVLHDELLNILGEHKQLKLGKEQNRIILLGLYGAGKCVHKDAKIQISNGEIINAEKLYNKYSNLNEKEIEDGKIIDISSQKLFVPSFNPKTGKMEDKPATHLWKLNKKEIYEIKIDSGNEFSVKVTPEHPFFTLRDGRIQEIQADQLSETDFIALPESIQIKGSPQSIIDKIKNLNLDIYLTKEEVNSLIKNKEIKKIQKNLKCSRNYCSLTISLKNGKIPIEFVDLNKFNPVKLKLKNSRKTISFPLYINSDFAEFIGYLMGDGHISKRYLEIVNEDEEIIKRVTFLSKQLFNLIPKIKKDLRTNKMYALRLSSRTLVELFRVFNLKAGKKGTNLEIPEEILKSDNEVVRSFIKAYFDCDGSPYKNSRQIELTSESKTLIQQMSFLLKRFSIFNSISCKKVKSKNYHRLLISGRSSEKYAEKISSIISHKKGKLDKFKLYGEIQGSGRGETIPLGNYLKKIRELGGFSIGEIQKYVYNYGRYEEFGVISKEKLVQLIIFYESKRSGVFPIILDRLNKNEKINYRIFNGMTFHLKNVGFIDENLALAPIGQKYLLNINQELFSQELTNLKILAFSDIRWIKVNEIEKIENDSLFVYDLTVEDNHSFIADNFIVHNTTTIAKLGNYFAKRGKKVCLIGLDVHRPAAKEQLKQLAEKNKLNYFIDLQETNAVKTWKKFEKNSSEYDLILVDTAGRHTLDKDLIEEIKDLGKTIKPTETILVMPADIGQAAKKQAKEFQDTLKISGVIVTRMDSTAKAGGALTACAETKAPVYFLTTGEKINDLEEFNPNSFLSRLLGMGDLQTLIEKVRSATDENSQEKIKKMSTEGKISLEDVIEQVKSMNSLGGFDKIKALIPGLGKANISDEILENQQGKISKWEHIIKSMTKEEKENPEIFEKQTSRLSRVAKGSGVTTTEIRSLLKQYKMLNAMLKEGKGINMSNGIMDQKQMMKLARKFGKKKMRF
jgi:signal recognition particle subunit SRP54